MEAMGTSVSRSRCGRPKPPVQNTTNGVDGWWGAPDLQNGVEGWSDAGLGLEAEPEDGIHDQLPHACRTFVGVSPYKATTRGPHFISMHTL